MIKVSAIEGTLARAAGRDGPAARGLETWADTYHSHPVLRQLLWSLTIFSISSSSWWMRMTR